MCDVVALYCTVCALSIIVVLVQRRLGVVDALRDPVGLFLQHWIGTLGGVPALASLALRTPCCVTKWCLLSLETCCVAGVFAAPLPIDRHDMDQHGDFRYSDHRIHFRGQVCAVVQCVGRHVLLLWTTADDVDDV